VFVKNSVEPPRLIEVSVDTMLYFLWRISIEVVGLTLHWTEARVREEDPLVHFVLFSGAVRVRDLVPSVVLLGEVLEDAAGFERTGFASHP